MATSSSALSASAAFVVGVAAASPSSPFDPHWALYPRSYSALYTPTPIAIDGDINKSVWQSIPFSQPFDEIRGADDAPPGTRPPPTCTTRVKMAWDSDYLYIAALIESDMTVVAKFTERNSPIFQKDSDFEVFVDPGGACHSYKELELNAINTVWNLMLDRPYGDGGSEHSGRVANPGDEKYYDVNGLKTATKILQGSINDDNDGESSSKRVVWSVEIALSHKDTLHAHPWGSVPSIGSFWRINFSRVEKQGDINWTWQPQKVWDPLARRDMGKVDMHRPDAFGYVIFIGQAGSEAGEAASIVDPTWPLRLAAMNVYYAQVVYAEHHAGKYATDVADLKDLVDEDIIDPFHISIACSDDGSGYVATIGTNDRGTVKVTNERLLTVQSDADVKAAQQ